MDNRYETDEEKEARIRREIMEEFKQNGMETEQQKKDRMRKEILDELNNNSNINNPANNSNIQSFGPPKKHSSVNFSNVSNNSVDNNSEIIENNESNNEQPNSGKSNIVLFVICAIIIVTAIAFLPRIKKSIDKTNKPKPIGTKEEKKEEDVLEKFTLETEAVKNANYPVLHTNSANKNTYLKLDKVTLNNISNNDILYNGLIDVYDGNMAPYKGGYSGSFCGNSKQKVSLDYRYVELRIEGKFNRTASYKHNDIVVPVDNPKTNYVGTWKYNSKSKAYVYYGACNKKSSNILYYDINSAYDVSNKLIDSKQKIIEMYLYNYIGFAAVNSKTKEYTIYSDANYTQKVTSGVLSTNNYQNELKQIVSNIGKEKLNKYLYTFSNSNCPYMEYCFKSGQWVK